MDAEVILPTSDKLKAIIEAQKPSDVNQLHFYLGSINYYAEVVPPMSIVLRPLHLLLMKNGKWKWSPECDKAIEQCNTLLFSQKVLVHYDSRKLLRLATDASPAEGTVSRLRLVHDHRRQHLQSDDRSRRLYSVDGPVE